MFGLDTKSLVIGVAIGYFVVPRITGPIVAKIGTLRNPETATQG